MVKCSSAQLPLRDLPCKHGREPFSDAADVGWLCLSCWETGVINSIWAMFLPSFRQNLRISGIQPWESDSRGTTCTGFLWGRKLTLPGHWPRACVHFMCFSTLRKTTIRCCLSVFNTQRWANNMAGERMLEKQISERKKKPNQLWHHLGEFELVWKWAEYLFAPPHMITLQKNNTSAKKKKKGGQTHTDFVLCRGKSAFVIQLCLARLSLAPAPRAFPSRAAHELELLAAECRQDLRYHGNINK